MKNIILLGLFTLGLSSFFQSSGMAPLSLELKRLFGCMDLRQTVSCPLSGLTIVTEKEVVTNVVFYLNSVMVTAFWVAIAQPKGLAGSDFFYASTLTMLDQLLKSNIGPIEEAKVKEAIRLLVPFQKSSGQAVGEGISIQLAGNDFIGKIPEDKKQQVIDFLDANKSNQPIVASVVDFLNAYYQAREVSSTLSRPEIQVLEKNAEEKLNEFSDFILTQLSK